MAFISMVPNEFENNLKETWSPTWLVRFPITAVPQFCALERWKLATTKTQIKTILSVSILFVSSKSECNVVSNVDVL